MFRVARLTRRRMLAFCSATLATLLARAQAASAGGSYEGPLVDAHAHLREGISPSVPELVSLYVGAGVRGALLFGEPWPRATEARDLYPDRFVPFLAEGYANALHPHSSYVNHAGLAELLAGGFVRGLGEIICRHSPYQLGAAGGYASAPANTVPADHPVLIGAYRLAGQYAAPVNVHQEWFYADELERAIQAAPATTFVWAHAGHGGPAVVRGLLDRNRNLLADISARTPWIGPGTVLLRPNGVLDAEWSLLLHEHSERFLIGLDLFAPAHYQPGYVGQMVAYYRGLLGQLDSDVAAMVGHGTADRIAPPSG